MKKLFCLGSLVFAGGCVALSVGAAESAFVGQWALNPAAGGAGWLEVRRAEGTLAGTLLWMGGSPETQSRVWLDGDKLVALRIGTEDIRDAAGKVVRKQTQPVMLTATLAGEEMRGSLSQPARDGLSVRQEEFTGVRIPPPPPAPDLSKVRFGEPIPLFNCKSLDGWKLVEAKAANGWSVRDGLLVNDPVQTPGQPNKHYGNLRTVPEFEDFNLTLEANVGKGQNSGVYLRGIYEVQVADTFGRPLDKHNLGAIYGRITPSVAAEKPPGEWQKLDITLVQRHATVKLNGKLIVDNAPLDGCTGGALWSDQTRPGPIYLQGDHTGIKYRNMLLRPVVK
jgi:hypothetical protein